MKKYVKVTATFDCDGDLIPEYIVWDDGRRYRIDKISDVRYAAGPSGPGQPDKPHHQTNTKSHASRSPSEDADSSTHAARSYTADYTSPHQKKPPQKSRQQKRLRPQHSPGCPKHYMNSSCCNHKNNLLNSKKQ